MSAKVATISDVALDQKGELVGQLVDKQGRGVAGAAISVKYGTREIARTVTNARGLYRIRGLRGGVHQVVAGQQVNVFRFWNAQAAPPSAKNSALTVVGASNVVRGQFGALGGATGVVTAAGAVTGATFGGLAYGEAKDANETSESNNALLNTLQNTNNQPASGS